MEAVKQGSATVGIKSKTHVVLVALKRASSELSAHQKKIVPIDDHLGISIAGLSADARILNRFMRNECLNNKYAYNSPMPVSRLVNLIGNSNLFNYYNYLDKELFIIHCCYLESQIPTQRYGRRPFGVGLLVAGYDDLGTHLYQTCPSANFYECKAMSIGARSQSARTYLEKHLNEFTNCSLDELIKHALRALRDTLPNEIELTTKNCSLSIVGQNTPFTLFDDDKVKPYLDAIEGDTRAVNSGVDETGHGGDDDIPPRPNIGTPQVTTAIETMEH